MEDYTLKNEKQEVKTNPLGETEKPKMAESPSDFFCSLKDCIQAALPLAHQQPLVAEVKWTVKYLINFVDEEVLQEALRKTTDLAFGRFLVAVGLFETDGGRDFAILLDDCQDLDECQGEEFDGLTDQERLTKSLVDEINHAATFPFYRETVEKLSNFFLLSKEEIINDFVIPHYKVWKSNHLWLEELTESAFDKAVKKHFHNSLSWWSPMFDSLRESFTVSDFVGIFEYVLEAQDAVLKEKEERRIRRIRERELEDQADEICLKPTDLINEVEYSDLQSRFGQLFSEEWGFFGSPIPLGLLFDLRSMMESLGLQYTFGEVCDFHQGFALQFDGDAQGCFYEAWRFLGQHSSEEEWQEDIHSLRECRGFLWESLRNWDSGLALKSDCCRFSLCKADYDFGEVNSLRLQANLAEQGLKALPTPKGFFGDSEGGNY